MIVVIVLYSIPILDLSIGFLAGRKSVLLRKIAT